MVDPLLVYEGSIVDPKFLGQGWIVVALGSYDELVSI